MNKAIKSTNPSQSFFVNANAGSGKTWLLLTRIIKCLIQGEKPENILAITFTNKAASEIQKRYFEKLKFLEKSSKFELESFLKEINIRVNSKNIKICRNLREKYKNNVCAIYTFHGWFNNLLTDGPTYSQKNKGFDIENSSQISFDIREIYLRKSEVFKTNKFFKLSLDFLFEEIGMHNTELLLNQLRQKKNEFLAYKDSIRLPFKKQINLDLFCAKYINKRLCFLFTNLSKLAIKKNYFNFYNECRNKKDFYMIYEFFFTKSGSLRKIYEKNNFDAVFKFKFDKLIQILSHLDDLIKKINYQNIKYSLFNIASYIFEKENLLKKDKKIIDFNDLEYDVYRLITSSNDNSLLYYVSSKYRQLLVDESQDINPVQWNILKTWLNSAIQSDLAPKIFFVGDFKQSIYSFRGSNYHLSKEIEKYIRKKYEGVVIALPYSYRSQKNINKFINTVSKELFEDFKPHITVSKNNNGCVEIIKKGDFGQDYNFIDQMLKMYPYSKKNNIIEAYTLCLKIMEILKNNLVIKNNELIALNYSDIMILVDRRTNLDIYEKMLNKFRIPFQSDSNNETLFKTDINLICRFLNNPFDNESLLLFINLPFFDKELSIKAKSIEDLTQKNNFSLSAMKTLDAILYWLSIANRLPVYDLLSNIFNFSPLRNYYIKKIGIEKWNYEISDYLNSAHEIDSARYLNLEKFIMKRKLYKSDNELIYQTESIKISSIHGAKGLESPVVFLIDTGKSTYEKTTYSFNISWSKNFSKINNISPLLPSKYHSSYQLKKQHDHIVSLKKEKNNLLYVALTRASQFLFISSADYNQNKDSWMNMILNFNVGISNATKIYNEAIYKEKNNFKNINKKNNKIQIGKRNYDILDHNLNWGVLVHKYLELTIPSDYDLFYRDQVGHLINELDKKERKDLDKIFQNIINRKELSFLFNESIYKSAINEFTFMLDQKTFVIDRIVEFEHKVYVLDYKIGLLKKIKKDFIENFKKQITSYVVAVKKIYPKKEIIGVLIYLDKTVFM